MKNLRRIISAPGALLAGLFVLSLLPFEVLADADAELTPAGADKNNRRNYVSNHPIDSVDPFTGNLKLLYQDVVLAGNGGLDIVATRVYDLAAIGLNNDGSRTETTTPDYPEGTLVYKTSNNWIGLGLGWSLNLAPKVIFGPGPLRGYGDAATSGPVRDSEDQVCTKKYDLVQYTLQLPNGQSEPFYRNSENNPGYVVTPSNWKYTCDGVGGMHRLYSPDGTMYEMGVDHRIWYPGETESRLSQATRVVDKNGNWLSIEYTSFGTADWISGLEGHRYAKLPANVTASDGRSISLIYDPGEPSYYPNNGFTHYYTGRQPQLLRIEASNGMVWQYKHIAGASPYSLLSEVIRPDQTSWKYSYWDHVPNAGTGLLPILLTSAQASSYRLKSVQYPTGGTIGYEYEASETFAMPLEKQSCTQQSPPMRTFYQTVRLKRKSTSDGGVWQYTYAPGKSEGQHDVTTISTPKGVETYKHIGYGYFTPAAYANNDPLGFICDAPVVKGAWRYGLLEEHTKGENYKEVYTWTPRSLVRSVVVIRGRLIVLRDGPNFPTEDGSIYKAELSSKVITQNGATYTTSYSNYDQYGNPGTVTESGPNGGNRTTNYTYYINTSKWILNQVKDENFPGGSTTRTFDANGNLLSITRDGVTTSYTYDSQGNVATTTFPRGLVHTYSNYKRGIPQTEVQPEGITITRIVSDAGNITSETNGEGRTTTYSYDGLNRVTAIGYPIGNATSISYDANSKTLTRGSLVESTTYDGFGRPTKITLGSISRTYGYDPLGRKTFESNPGSTSGTGYQYDILDRVTRITNADGTYQVIGYSGANKTVTDERGNTTTYSYRAYGDPTQQFLMSISAPEASASIAMTRNARDLITSVTQGGFTRNYGYNGNYYLTSVVNPETGTTTYGRDAAGNMTSRSVGSSGTTNYTYDGQNRLTGAVYPGTTPSVTKTYSKTHKLKTVTSSAAARSYGYDANDNLTSESVTADGIALTTGYAYNGNDQLTSITYPRSGRVVSYSPDVLGRPTLVSGYINSVSYWPSGQVKQIAYSNGTVTNYNQNSRLWPSSFSTQKGATSYINSSYGYDGVGNLTAISDSADSSYNRTLGFDKINRLTSISGPWGAGTVAYNGVGNITSQVLGAYNLYYYYDTSNRLGSVSGARVTSYSYDAYGNIVTGSGNSYTYDGVPNLRCINCSNASLKVENTYDGLNQRISVTKAGVKSYEVYGSHGNQLIEYTPSQSNKLVEYIYLGGKRVAQRVTP